MVKGTKVVMNKTNNGPEVTLWEKGEVAICQKEIFGGHLCYFPNQDKCWPLEPGEYTIEKRECIEWYQDRQE